MNSPKRGVLMLNIVLPFEITEGEPDENGNIQSQVRFAETGRPYHAHLVWHDADDNSLAGPVVVAAAAKHFAMRAEEQLGEASFEFRPDEDITPIAGPKN